MSDDIFIKGTIKVKNADGKMVPFFPQTKVSCVGNSKNVLLSQTMNELAKKTNGAESAGGIEIIHVEPTEETTEQYINESLIAWYQNPDLDGTKHMTVLVSSDAENRLLKVGDKIHFTYVLTNDGGE